MTNPYKSAKVGLRDRPVRDYFARFLDFFFAAFTCGAGGVRSILRSTSSRLGCVFAVGLLMDGVYL